MPLPKDWATPEDFATLFQYMWYRDFPMDRKATGASRTDWTIHIGVAVRNIAALMGIGTRFETGKRTDAVLRSWAGDEVALEWEWDGVRGNELDKLKCFRPRSFQKEPGRLRNDPNWLLRLAVLITYTDKPIREECDYVGCKWTDSRWPLLLILIDGQKTTKLPSHRQFRNINMFLFDNNGERQIREPAPAYPWEVEDTFWSKQAA